MDIFAKADPTLALLKNVAAQQLCVGQAIAFLLGGTSGAGMEKAEIKQKLAEQNHALQRAIEEI